MLISFTFNSYNILSIHYVHSTSFDPLIRTKTSRKKVQKICPPQQNYLTLRRSKERCRSGRSGRSRKPLYPYGYPGFESLSFRYERKSKDFLFYFNRDSNPRPSHPSERTGRFSESNNRGLSAVKPPDRESVSLYGPKAHPIMNCEL